MRLAVLDVGSNTVHLLVVDALRGRPAAAGHSDKAELQLSEHVTDDGTSTTPGASAGRRRCGTRLEVAEDRGTEDLLAFATSALREAP